MFLVYWKSGKFFLTVYYPAAQQYDPVTKAGSDASSRDWTIEPREQSLRSRYRTHVDFSVYQKVNQVFLTNSGLVYTLRKQK